MIRIKVGYVDKIEIEAEIEEWPDLRSDGINYIAIGSEHFTYTSGHSIYWVYREGDNWVMGSGPVGYGDVSPEVVVAPDGTQTARKIQFMPDLHIKDVKIGWWWPDEKRRPIDGDNLPTE